MRWTPLAVVPFAYLLSFPAAWAVRADEPRDGPEAARIAKDLVDSLRDEVDRRGPLALLGSPAILQTLEVTKDQRQKLQRLEDDVRERRMSALKIGLGGGPGGIRPHHISEATQSHADTAYLRQSVTTLRAEQQAKVASILNPEQLRWFWRIALQVEGPLAIAWPEIQDGLNMTPDQRSRVEDIRAALNDIRNKAADGRTRLYKEFDAKHTAPSPERKATREAFIKERSAEFDRIQEGFDEARAKASQGMMRLLTRRQKRIYEKLEGEPLDLAELLNPPKP